MIYEMVDGELMQMVTICTGCLRDPQAPAWDQCIGCGKTEAEQARVRKPARECVEYGISSPVGIRWTGQTQ